MPRKKASSQSSILNHTPTFLQQPSVKFALTCLAGAFILVLPFYVMAEFISNKPGIRSYCRETKDFIQENQEALRTVFTQTFDEAHKCGTSLCSASVSAKMLNSFQGTHEMRDFPATYFVRLQDKELEKLTLSARFTSSPIHFKGEKTVANILRGRGFGRCDQGWKMDQSNSTMRYLYDMHAEAEVILPVRQDGKVLGVVVRAWGD